MSKLYLLLICAVFINVSEANSDCNDLVSCAGNLIGRAVRKNSETANPNALMLMGNILNDLSQTILDTFKNIVLEINYTKHDLNDTEFDVQTFKINDKVKFNETSDKIKVFALDNFEDTNNSSSVSHYLISVENSIKNGNKTYLPTIEISADRKILTEEMDFSTTLHPPNIRETSIYYETEYPPTENPIYEIIKSQIDLNGTVASSNLRNIEYEMTSGTNQHKSFSNAVSVNPISASEPTVIDVIKNLSLSFLENQEISKNTTSLNDKTEVNDTINENNTVLHNIAEILSFNQGDEADVNDLTDNSTSTEERNLKLNNVTSTTNHSKNDSNVLKQMTLTNKSISSGGGGDFENLISNENEISFYEDTFKADENDTDYLAVDYVSLFKDITVEDVAYTVPNYRYVTTTSVPVTTTKVTKDNGIESVYPWIATLFIKDREEAMFQYICDGSLLSDRVVLTAARCLTNVTEDVQNILVIFGKRSLQAVGPNERVFRVNYVKRHEAFNASEGRAENDLAIIVLDEPVADNDNIRPANITDFDIDEAADDDDGDDDDLKPKEKDLFATTGWHVTGPLTPIYFEEVSKKECDSLYPNTFCAVFENSVTTCPSFGGAFVSKEDGQWRLRGIMTAEPKTAGVCFNRKVTFINLSRYYPWIMANKYG